MRGREIGRGRGRRVEKRKNMKFNQPTVKFEWGGGREKKRKRSEGEGGDMIRIYFEREVSEHSQWVVVRNPNQTAGIPFPSTAIASYCLVFECVGG